MGTTEERANEQARDAWNANAAWWDRRMGEGNDFVEVLTWPSTERLLQVQPGQHILDIACGNGLTSRRLAALGAEVVAFDLSPEMIAHAQERTSQSAERISYRVVDATDEAALLALGEGRFDAALCHMALFDVADIKPLTHALAHLLRPGGRYVFSVLHPCFNNLRTALVGQRQDRDGQVVTTYGVEITGYMTPTVGPGIAMPDQPAPHPVVHRPLHMLLGVCFEAGFVLDGLEERAFPPDYPPRSHPLTWGSNFSEIPPVLVARMLLPGR